VALELLNDLKKKKINDDEKKYFKKYVVLGLNPYGAKAYLTLREKFGVDQVILLSENRFSEEDLEFFGPSTIRGEKSLKIIGNNFPLAELIDHEVLFYKELKFKSFDSKAKSEPLLFGEDYYLEKRASISEQDILNFSSEEVEILRSEVKFSLVSKVDKTDPTDLIDQNHWEVRTSANEVYACENLICSENPQNFFKKCSHKEKFSNEFVAYCEKTIGKSALFIRTTFKEEVCADLDTYYIPLSYTHEWGHLIGEFSKFDQNQGIQRAEFVTFVDELESNEEEISKKIRYFKKNLKKIFYPEKDIEAEFFIKFVDNYACQKIDQSPSVMDELKRIQLSFVGGQGLLGGQAASENIFEDSSLSPEYFPRALLTLALTEPSAHTIGIREA
jgi:hypothetical protein